MKQLIVDKIKQALEQQNVSQSELARRMKVSRSRVSKILQGTNLTVETLVEIAKHLNLKWNITLKEL